jgi:sensor histidine kinase YesM
MPSFVEPPEGRPLAAFLTTGLRREILFWLLNLSFWGAVVMCYLVVSRITNPGVDAAEIRSLIFQRSLCGFVIAVGLRYFYKGMRLGGFSIRRTWMLAIVVCFAVSFVETLLSLKFLSSVSLVPTDALGGMFVLRSALFGIWTTMYLGSHLLEDYYALRIREVSMEKAFLQSEMKRMQSQMNPHFLFNALNAVLASRHDPEEVEEITHALAEYLRFSLQEARSLEPLARELDSLEKYLMVQQIRFGKGLVCGIECETAARDVLVPPMLVQPLLENAFNYGEGLEGQALRVRVAAHCKDGRTLVTVTNTGSWIPHGDGRSPGIGIQNLRHRLALIFGEAATMKVEEVRGSVVVTIDMPMLRDPADLSRVCKTNVEL